MRDNSQYHGPERRVRLHLDSIDVRDAEHKQIFKEAITEWLDEKFTMLGKWTFNGLLAATLAWGMYGWLQFNGWVHR